MQKFHEILHHFSLTVWRTYGAPLVPLQKIFFIWWPPDNMWWPPDSDVVASGHHIAICWPPYIIWWPPDSDVWYSLFFLCKYVVATR